MLVLSRKTEQSLMLGPDITLTVLAIEGDRVKLGIRAPRSVSVLRQELYDQLQTANNTAASLPPMDLRRVAAALNTRDAASAELSNGRTAASVEPSNSRTAAPAELSNGRTAVPAELSNGRTAVPAELSNGRTAAPAGIFKGRQPLEPSGASASASGASL